MYFSFILEDEKGNQIDFTQSQNQYIVSSIDGLTEPTATIATVGYATTDGSYLSSALIQTRNIVVNFNMCGIDIEAKRKKLYDVVKTGQYIKCKYKTKLYDVYAEGVVESCTINNFESLISGQISIICSDPFWYEEEEIEYNMELVTGAFVFAFSSDATPITTENSVPFSYYSNTAVTLVNNGIDTGVTIKATILRSLDTFKISNIDTGEYIEINYDFEEGDIITISTKPMNKTITLLRDGETINIINYLAEGSTWLSLPNGTSNFIVDKGTYAVSAIMYARTAYLGV